MRRDRKTSAFMRMNTIFKASVFICVCLWPAFGAVDYTKFSHATPKHKSVCNTCHKPPTKNWTKASTFPDISDFPDHDACVTCHRPQFFRGDRPPICSVCHVKTSPRDEARYAFRNPATKLQFTIDFPHDRHQDVIALQRHNPRSLLRLAHAAPQTFNNCTICHAQPSVAAKPPPGGWLDSYAPPLATFKASPADHSSCFACHWKSQEPVASNCNGCHKLATTPSVAATAPTRISLKFIHEGGGDRKQHVAECTSCHINITKSATSRGLKPDVPITACTECHNKEGLRQDLNTELTALDKNRAFTCSYCHTSNVGKLDAPASHYLIAQRPPLKRSAIR
jgi:hypothetical protein